MLRKYIPYEYQLWNSTKPYFAHFFRIVFWRRLKFLIGLASKYLNEIKKDTKKILDVGCGMGFSSLNLGYNFPTAKIIGIDIKTKEENKFINRLFNKFSIKFEILSQDIQKKTIFFNNYFDLIIAFDVLEHLNQCKVALNQIIRILSINGKLLVSVPVESRFLKILRGLHSLIFKKKKIFKDSLTKHWQGDISSVKDFITHIKNNFRIEFRKRFPNNFPLFFSYDLFFILSK